MILKILGAALALATTAFSSQMPFGYQYTFDVISNTTATSGWERTSDIVTGPTYVKSDHVFRNTTWSVYLPPYLQDVVRSSAPFDWVESGGTDKITYGMNISSGHTGYIAVTSMWYVLTGTLRTLQAGNIIDEQIVTTISPKTLANGEIDGTVTFITLHRSASSKVNPSPLFIVPSSLWTRARSILRFP